MTTTTRPLSETQHDALTALASRPLTMGARTILDRDRVHGSVARALIGRGYATLEDDQVTITVDGRQFLDQLGNPTPAATPPPALPADTPEPLAVDDGRVLQLPVEHVHPATDNVRREVGDLTGLADSIVAAGILEPLLVTPLVDSDGWRIVAGHRRHAAAVAAGLATVPCIVRILDDEQRLEAMTIENLQRVDLTPLEEADAFHRLVELGWTQTRIAQRVGIDQGTVSKRLSLRKLPDDALDLVADGTLPLDSAYAAAKLPADRLTAALHKQALDGSARAFGSGTASRDLELSIQAHLREYRDDLARQKARRQLDHDGVPVIDHPDLDGSALHSYTHVPGFTRMAALGAGAPNVETHSRATCHAAIITSDGHVVYGCTDPDQHTQQTQAEHRAQPNEWDQRRVERDRRETAWHAVVGDRHAWLAQVLARLPLDAHAQVFALAMFGGSLIDEWSISHVLTGLLNQDLATVTQQSRDGVVGPTWSAWVQAIAAGEAAASSRYLHRFDDDAEAEHWMAQLYLAELDRIADVAAGVALPGGHDHHQQLAALLDELDTTAVTAAA